VSGAESLKSLGEHRCGCDGVADERLSRVARRGGRGRDGREKERERRGPMSAASSMLVVAYSALTKNLCSNLAKVSGWWRTALARLVLPIPPPPRMAIHAGCWLSIFIILSNSDSRPRGNH
jgi:hypothetical protein